MIPEEGHVISMCMNRMTAVDEAKDTVAFGAPFSPPTPLPTQEIKGEA